MSAASNFLETKLLDHALRVTAYNAASFSSSATLYLALFNNTSTNTLANLEAGTLTDETSTSSTGYTRKAVAFSAATGTNPTTSVTSGPVTFDAATASWGTITHIAVMDGGTAGAGNVLFYGAVTTSKTIDTGDTFQVSAGNLTISLA